MRTSCWRPPFPGFFGIAQCWWGSEAVDIPWVKFLRLEGLPLPTLYRLGDISWLFLISSKQVNEPPYWTIAGVDQGLPGIGHQKDIQINHFPRKNSPVFQPENCGSSLSSATAPPSPLRLSAAPLATRPHHSAGVTRDTRDNLSSYSYTAFEDSRTCEASLEKSKVALPWYTANLDPCETQTSDLNCWRYGEFYRYHPQEELAIHKWRLWAERVWFPCEMNQVPEYETVERHLCQVSLLSLGAPQLSKNTEHMWT